jgi:hypothetical protein
VDKIALKLLKKSSAIVIGGIDTVLSKLLKEA